MHSYSVLPKPINESAVFHHRNSFSISTEQQPTSIVTTAISINTAATAITTGMPTCART